MSNASLPSPFSSNKSHSAATNPVALPRPQKVPAWNYATAKVPAWAVTSTATTAHPAQAASMSDDAQARHRSASTMQPIPKASPLELAKKSRKRRKLLAEEHALMKQAASRLEEYISCDRQATLHPDVDTPFVDAADVVRRLLPYHVWQQPADDLATLSGYSEHKGKKKTTEVDAMKADIANTRNALNCSMRKRKLDQDFQRIMICSGTRPGPEDMLYYLEHHALDTERNDNTSLTYELRNARTELDAVERQRKSRATTPARAPSQPLHTTPTAPYSTYPGYGYAQVAPYQFAYAQYVQGAGGSAQTTAVAGPVPYPGYRAPGSAPTPAAASPPSRSTTSTLAPTISAPQAVAPSAIPVQLPVNYLPALAQLGIVPVTAASVPAGAPRPACIITGASHDGTTLTLEINVGMLRPPQVNGIAVVLTSLVNSRTSAVTASQAPGSVEADAERAQTDATMQVASPAEVPPQKPGE